MQMRFIHKQANVYVNEVMPNNERADTYNVHYHRQTFGKENKSHFYIRTWPVCPGDIGLPGVQICTSYVKAFESYRLTDRQTDRHDRNYIPYATWRVVNTLLPLCITVSLDSFSSRWTSWASSSWSSFLMSSDLTPVHLHFHHPSLLLSGTPRSKLISCTNLVISLLMSFLLCAVYLSCFVSGTDTLFSAFYAW